MLIPLRDPGSFALVDEQAFAIYIGCFSGKVDIISRTSLAVSNEAPRYPGLSSRAPLWANWISPARNTKLVSTRGEQVLYLGREDGLLRYFILNKTIKGQLSVTSQSIVGFLEGNIDTAFEFLDLGRHRPDFILVGGGTRFGGVYEVSLLIPQLLGLY
jgi:hypothetical protein